MHFLVILRIFEKNIFFENFQKKKCISPYPSLGPPEIPVTNVIEIFENFIFLNFFHFFLKKNFPQKSELVTVSRILRRIRIWNKKWVSPGEKMLGLKCPKTGRQNASFQPGGPTALARCLCIPPPLSPGL